MTRIDVTVEDGVTTLMLDGQPVMGTVTSVVRTGPGNVPQVLVQLPHEVIAAPTAQSAAGFVQSLNPVALQRQIEEYGDMDTSVGEAAVAVLARLAAQE